MTDFIPFPVLNGSSAVEMAHDEFLHIYELVKGCLSTELLGGDTVEEGEQLIRECRKALQNERSTARYHDFMHGFLPLYEKLHEARTQINEGEVARMSVPVNF